MLTTTRRGISYPNPTRTDAPDIPLHIQNLANILDLDTPFYTGTDAAKPATGSVVQGSFYWATDTGILYLNTGTWTALASKASPALTGTPTAPTPAVTDNSTAIATTAFVRSITPPGVVMPYVGATAPAGYLLCDGSAQSRATYAALFAILGTTYGAGDGSTTFNLPDLRGRIPVGKNTATFATLGAVGGEETHLLTVTEEPSHTHTFSGSALPTHIHNFTGAALGTHTHVFTGNTLPTHSHTFTGTAMGTHTHTFSGSALATHSHTFSGSALPDHHHRGTTNEPDVMWDNLHQGSGGGFTGIKDIAGGAGASSGYAYDYYTGTPEDPVTRNPVTLTPAGSINSVSAGTPAGTNSAVSAGTPAGTLSSDSAGTPSGTNAAVSAGTPSGTLDAQSAGTPAGTNSNTGGGAAHNNLQPYLVLNYIVKF